MKRIGIISDTHGFFDHNILRHFEKMDEIWHAGDFGNAEIASQLSKVAPVKGVFGNIDGNDIRTLFPELLVFTCEDVKVMMRHIGGAPPKYNAETKKEFLTHRPKLFISGHSHILKILYDENMSCLHINPGAAGRQGWHKVRTIVRFIVDGEVMRDAEVIELGPR